MMDTDTFYVGINPECGMVHASAQINSPVLGNSARAKREREKWDLEVRSAAGKMIVDGLEVKKVNRAELKTLKFCVNHRTGGFA